VFTASLPTAVRWRRLREMQLFVWIFALIGAAVHLLAFAWEVLLFERPGVHRGIFAIPTSDVPAVRL
jgi:putative membrane protein